ncbi:MAG: FecR domain-containing protein [Alphaproteobacteria bacterium]|nr:FecR domain-containing protein [Alphaproteobacteria bacterium]
MTKIDRRAAWRVLMAAVALVVLDGASTPPCMAAASGQVLALRGTVTIENDGKRRATAVGDPVGAGDTIDVSEASKVRLRMDDGSMITVAAASKLTIDSYEVDGRGARQNARLTLSSGLLHAVVSAGGSAPNFEVESTFGAAAVRGTDLYVDAQPGKTEVYVLTGEVTLADADHRDRVTIPQMSWSSAEAHKAPNPPRPAPKERLAALAERARFALGLCQCLAVQQRLTPNCQPATDACQASCNGGSYGFVPSAPGTCGAP